MENVGWFALMAYTVFSIPFLWLAGWGWSRWRKAKRARVKPTAYAPDIERTIDLIMQLPKAERDEMARKLDALLAERGKM